MVTNNRHRRFYCTNVAGCTYAARDHVYDFAAFESGNGLCTGLKHDGCGLPLKEGKPHDPRPIWLTLAVVLFLLLTASGAAVKNFVFPDPIQDIAFSAPETRLDGSTSNTLIHVRLIRKTPAEEPVAIQYRAEPQTAVAGLDYEASEGIVTIDPGKQEAEITLMVHPDPANTRPDRSFAVVLTNVEGQPRHYVTLTERKVDSAEEQRLRAVVRSASRLAKDVADGAVRRHVFAELLAASRDDPDAFTVAQTKLQNAQDDLSRAREQYVEVLRSLQAFQPRQVFDAMTAVSKDQKKAGFHQQAKATDVMKRQFQEFAKDGRTYLDKWSDELSQVVPAVPKGGPNKQI